MTVQTLKRINYAALGITVLTILCAVLWAFPLYWGVITSLKPESHVVRPVIELWPETFTIEAYVFALTKTKIGIWYINSLITATLITILTISSGILCGYAISQLRFPGRLPLYWIILASFMVPTQALIVNHFVLMAELGLLNSIAGIVIPQLIHPVVVIVYKQFFDGVPKEYREAAKMDNAGEVQMLLRIYLPMNWGVTTALAIITFIGAWNSFLWPFLAVSSENMMTITVGITQVSDSFGINYAHELAAAVLAGLPVAIAYLIFQKRVTQAIMLSAGIKG